MITLYKYLRESIFDDEDDVSSSSDIEIINNTLLKELSSKLFMHMRGLKKDNVDACKLENKTLYIDAKSTCSGCALFGQTFGVMSLFKEIKEQTEIELIESNGSINISEWKLNPSTFCKKIKATSVKIFNTSSVQDMDFEISNECRFSDAINFDCGAGELELKNVTVNIAKGKQRRPIVYFDTIPELSNCKFNGANILNLRDPFIFDRDKTKKLLDKFFDSKHEVYYKDGRKPDTIKRSGKWIKLKAAVNNKKLEFVSSDNDKVFNIAEGARLSDIIDLKMFPDVEYIIIRDNNVSVDFNKNGKDFEKGYYRNHPNILQLPNDPEWTVEVYKV